MEFRRKLGLRIAQAAALALMLLALCAAAKDTSVYITRTGSYYHRENCASLRRSSIKLTLGEAATKGYMPCSLCEPPRPNGRPRKQPQAEVAGERLPVILVRITDGDTIHVLVNGKDEPVRLIGINAPEKHKRINGRPIGPPEPLSSEATDFLAQVLDDRSLWQEYDTVRRDKYERLLAYIWAQGKGDKQPLLVNAQMLRWGFAVVLTIPPNTRYIVRLKKAEEEAKREELGVWSK
jgi:endonuclease YncB( thermonuclease family)